MGAFDGEWFEAQLERVGKSRIELGKALGTTQPDLALLLTGERELKLSEVELLSKFLEVSWNQLMAKTGTVGEEVEAKPFGHSVNISGDTAILVASGGLYENADIFESSQPMFDIIARRGEEKGGGAQQPRRTQPQLLRFSQKDSTYAARSEGGLLDDPQDADGGPMPPQSRPPPRNIWSLPRGYTDHHLGVDAKNAQIIEVEGDSMEPTLHAGDRVMIDLTSMEPSPAGIFALWDGSGVVIKRIEKKLGANPPTLLARSDSPHYDDVEMCEEAATIVGRVVWAARKM